MKTKGALNNALRSPDTRRPASGNRNSLHLIDRLSEPDLTYYGSTVCRVCRPFVVPQSIIDSYYTPALALARAIGALANSTANAHNRAELLGIDQFADSLLGQNSQISAEFACRADGIVDETGSIKFIEYNPGSPGGMFFNDILADVFLEYPDLLKSPGDVSPARPVYTGPHYINALFYAASAASALKKASRFLLVTPNGDVGRGVAVSPEISRLCSFIRLRGHAAVVAAADEVDLYRETLIAKGESFDIAIVLIWIPMLAEQDATHFLYQPALFPKTWLADPVSSFIVRGSKALFALLNDPRFKTIIGTSDFNLLQRHIPWTTKLSDQIYFGDKKYTLEEFVRSHQIQLVLKKAISYGGSDVHLGWEMNETDWLTQIRDIDKHQYILQHRVQPETFEAPLIRNGTVTMAQMFHDFSPYIWNDRIAHGACIRLSTSGIMNVTSGTGSASPLFTSES